MILIDSGWQMLGIALGWGFIVCLGLSLWALGREIFEVGQRLHQVPCARCQFFTNCAVLKCTVHPDIAFSEQAIHCPDFQP